MQTTTQNRYWLWLTVDRFRRNVTHIADRQTGQTVCGKPIEQTDRETTAELEMCVRCDALAPRRWGVEMLEPPRQPARLPGAVECPAGHGSVDQIGEQIAGKGIKPGYWRCRKCSRVLVGAVRVWR